MSERILVRVFVAYQHLQCFSCGDDRLDVLSEVSTSHFKSSAMFLTHISGFQCYQGGGVNYGQVCVSNVVGTSLTNLWLAPDDYPETTPGSLSLTSTTAPQVILNNGIPVMWQSTDSQILLLLASRSSSLAGVVLTSQPISTSSISSSSSTTTPSATNSTSTLPSSSSIPSESAAAKSTGLSSGAKAGIGVGAGVGALLLLAFLFLLVRRYRKQATLREKQSLSATREAGPSRLEFKHELSGHGYVHDKDQEKKVYEAQSNPLSELSTTKQHTVGELE